jgi:curved DNA-binding protein CbpA
VLGVAPDASADEIKRSYRKLAQKHHPDHDPSPDAAERFDRIAKAYAVLGDVRRREWYDKMVAGEIAA